MRIWLLFTLVLLLVSSCYYDKEAILYPETNCVPPATPSYQADVVPIMNQYCVSCHSGSFASAGVKLDSYPEVMKSVNNGQLMGTITWAAGYSPMPKNGNKLSACNIGKIEAWIAAGSPNN
jgi:mono/diheme cytochrome c family protein